MELPAKRRSMDAQRVDAQLLDAEDFDTMVLHLLTPPDDEAGALLAPDAPDAQLLGAGKHFAERGDSPSGTTEESQPDAADAARGALQLLGGSGARVGVLGRLVLWKAASLTSSRTDAKPYTGARSKRRRTSRQQLPLDARNDLPSGSESVAPPPFELSATELLMQASPSAASYIGRLLVLSMALAARAEPRAPIGNFCVKGLGAVAAACSSLSTLVTRHAGELRDASAALRLTGDCDAPAWQLGRRVPPHGENALHVLQLHMNALAATLEDGLSPTRGYEATFGRPLSAPERGHIADMTFMLGELHKFLASAQSMLAQLRCRRGGAPTYLDCAAGVLDLIAHITSHTATSNLRRIEEFGARAAADVVWPSRYLEHAKAVGAAP